MAKARGKTAGGAPRTGARSPKPLAIAAQAAANAEERAGAERDCTIAVAVYYRAERRGFAPGCELDDWLAAESEFEAQCRRQETSRPRGGA